MRSTIMLRTSRLSRSLRLRPFSNANDKNPSQQHAMFREQMEELKQEREALYGFTDQEQKAWGNAKNSHRHSDDFLQQIEQARMEAQMVVMPSWSHSEDHGHTNHSHGHNHHHRHHHHHGHHGHQDHHNNNQQQSSEDDANLQGYRLMPPVEQPIPEELNNDTLPPLFTHLSPDGSTVQMVHVGDKAVTARRAVAQTTIVFPPEIVQHGFTSKKGPIFETAILAGIMAAKKTSDLIPLCHPLPLEQVNVGIQMPDANTAVVTCECHVTHKTGVEMEAMVGASVAALTVYDMVKAISHNVVVKETKLLHKSGGKRHVDE